MSLPDSRSRLTDADALRRLASLSASRLPDYGLALVAAVGTLVYDTADHNPPGEHGWSIACGLLIAASFALRRVVPWGAVFGVTVGLCLTPEKVSDAFDAVNLAFMMSGLIAFTMGARNSPPQIVTAVAALVAGLETQNNYFNPFFVTVVGGAGLLARILRVRRELATELAARGKELEAEKELFARESVRLERARIARELHDIVAHCVSVMVVQAGAGQRLTHVDPQAAAEALDAISEVAKQAASEIGRLVELLSDEEPTRHEAGWAFIDELVTRMRAAKIAVSLRLEISMSDLPTAVADACYRVVQESLTNALKHSPGSTIEIGIVRSSSSIEVTVVNGHSPGAPSGLESSGSGYGVKGMAERVQQCGGHRDVGPTADGGWRVRALLPEQWTQMVRRIARPDLR